MRKHITTLVAVAVATTLALAGCTTAKTAASSTSVLTVGRGNGTQTNNSNPFVSTSSTQSLGYGFVIYEPLAQVNVVRPTQKPVPWLATEWKWNTERVIHRVVRKNSSPRTAVMVVSNVPSGRR